MTFQSLPTPFQPYAKVYTKVPSTLVPTPVLPYPHTPKALRLLLAAWRSLSVDVIQRTLTAIYGGFDMVPMPPFVLGGGTVDWGYAFALCGHSWAVQVPSANIGSFVPTRVKATSPEIVSSEIVCNCSPSAVTQNANSTESVASMYGIIAGIFDGATRPISPALRSKIICIFRVKPNLQSRVIVSLIARLGKAIASEKYKTAFILSPIITVRRLT